MQDFDPTLDFDFDPSSSSLEEIHEGDDDDHIDSGVSDVSSETSGQRSPRPVPVQDETASPTEAILDPFLSTDDQQDPFFADIGKTTSNEKYTFTIH